METVNKVLSKLGIYDLIVVLFTGILICTLTIAMIIISGFSNLFSIFASENLKSYTSLIFLISSYFIGLMFQEIGSYEQRYITNKDNKLLKRALHTEDNSYVFLTEKELESIFEYVSQKIDCKINNSNSQENLDKYHINMVYNYCRYYVVKNFDTSRMDRDQSLAAMSRSLHIYFMSTSIFTLIFFVVPLFFGFFFPTYLYLFIISVSTSVLMYFRNYRLAQLRYIYVFRLFYYFVVKKDENNQMAVNS